MSKLTFRVSFLSDNSGAVRLVILKNDFGRLGEVGQHDKNVLAVRRLFFCSSPPFLCGELAVCKTLRERAFTK